MYSEMIKKNSDNILSSIIIILCVISSYNISSLASKFQLKAMNLDIVPRQFSFIFKISDSIAGIVPLLIACFIFFNTKIILNHVFDMKVRNSSLFYYISVSMIPLLIHLYFVLYNLFTYLPTLSLAELQNFENVRFSMGLRISDFQFISSASWELFFIIFIFLLYRHKIPIYKVLFSVLFAPAIFLVLYYFFL